MRSLGLIPVISLLLAGFLVTGSLIAEKPLWTAPGGSPIAISANGTYVLSGGEPVRLYNASGEEQWAGYGAEALAITRDGRYSIIGDAAGVRYIDRSQRTLWSNYDLGPIEDISLSPDEHFIASVADNCVLVFGRDGQLLGKACYPGMHSAAISNNGMTVAGTFDSIMALSYRGSELWRYPAPGIEEVAISQTFESVAVSDYTLLFLNSSGNLLWQYMTSNTIRDLRISSDASSIAAGNQAGDLYLFNRTGGLLWKKNLGNWINAVSLSSDGSLIAAGGLDRKVHLFDRDGALLWEYSTESPVEGIALSSDGSFLVAGTDDGNISLFDLRGIQSLNVPRTNPLLPESTVTTGPSGLGISEKTPLLPRQQRPQETLFPSYSITPPVQPATQKTASGCSIGLALGIFLLMARRRI
jgi:WD40 repeat protein